MRYRPGQQVRIATRPHDGHHRTPGYVKGKTGRVERVHAAFANPETRAYGREGLPKQPLYHVGFAHDHVWPDAHGRAGDRIYVDIFEHWLEEAE
jgi:nitrile hydratase subunit beta